VPVLGRVWGRWARIEVRRDVPWAPLTPPLDHCRATLITTGGVHLSTDPPFDMANPAGDPSVRAIPVLTSMEDLRITHDYYDHRDADRDPNIVFPLERFRELVKAGRLGGLAPTHWSFMGHITGSLVEQLETETIPALVANLRLEQLDFAFLTPAWGLCHQSVGLIQRAIEAAGIPTVSVSLLRGVTEKLGVPRAVAVRWPFGHPLGEPFNRAQQLTVIRDALGLLRAGTPGTIVSLPYPWRRYQFVEPQSWAFET
jgi:D-proline reductase (dithiol) PrdB